MKWIQDTTLPETGLFLVAEKQDSVPILVDPKVTNLNTIVRIRCQSCVLEDVVAEDSLARYQPVEYAQIFVSLLDVAYEGYLEDQILADFNMA